MPRSPRSAALLLTLAEVIASGMGLGLTACGRSETSPPPGVTPAAPGDRLTLRRGPFERHLALTGEIDTVAAVELKVPRVPNGKVPIRYLAPEGAEVKAGDVVVELDSTSFVLEIKDRTLQLSQAEIDLERQISQNGVLEADKALDVERKRAVVKRAEVDADVPEGILPKRDYLEKQLALERARADLARAEDALASQKVSAAADVKLKRLAVEKLRRAAAVAQEAISTLTLRTTEPGTVIISDHPEERRKLQEGDDVFMGTNVARVTSGSGRRVRAWLSDVDDGKITPGQQARVVLDAHPDRTFTGTVRDISPVARSPGDPRAQRRVFTVGVDLGEVDAAVLRPGLSARVEVLADRRAQALLAPRAAIAWTAEGPRARLQDGSEVVVALGGCNRDVCVVERGLDAAAVLARVTP
jgi:multidrug resistance efflux pump